MVVGFIDRPIGMLPTPVALSEQQLLLYRLSHRNGSSGDFTMETVFKRLVFQYYAELQTSNDVNTKISEQMTYFLDKRDVPCCSNWREIFSENYKKCRKLIRR